MSIISDFYKGKTILVTGGAGSIGSAIVKSLLKCSPASVRVLDINETGLFDLGQDLKSENLRLFVGDIKDSKRLARAIEDVDIVFHAAALKHVPLCEYNPFEAVKTNAVGTQNLINAAIDEGVEKFVTISTDKAVNPVNVMGATKLLAERLTMSANLYKGNRSTAFSCVRFGNVTHTRGSVIPLFTNQIKNGLSLTVTDRDMTRFIMSIEEASKLVLEVPEIAQGSEIFILKMPSMRMGDLADAMIEYFAPKYGRNPKDINIDIIGRRPGEKMFEELMSQEEALDAYENENMFIICSNSLVQSTIANKFKKVSAQEYSSANTNMLDKDELIKIIM